ncbi:hypothetical protein FE257_005863 [Aspergillus nanangensis]|uniref:Transcription factor domain-containing protein n=1 Tax=Aspergillus nanangensis TaxID=2582783 RepID=A0AAD4GWF1_ASPNN|nr:hypothetical protein FE257_005863 [Aspergillus nanangensis]
MNQNISCKFDTKFKRQRVRGSLEKVTKENERLRHLVHTSETAHAELNSSLPPASDDADSPSLRQEAAAFSTIASQIPSPQALEGVQLDGPTLVALFEHFADHYLLHLPILDLAKPINSIWNDNRLLFWTIVVISTSKHPVYSPYFPLLQAPFKRLLSEFLVNSIRCIYTVQALLLLCLWPFPVEKQQDDPSWDYSGMAVAATLKLTSNDSQTKWPGSNELCVEESLRLKTWLGCFAVTTNLGAALALPPPMGMVAEMMPRIRSRVQSSLPEEFLIFLDIQDYATRAASMLRNHPATPLQRSLVELLERDLAAIEARISYPSHPRVQLWFLAARLRLCALPMLSQISSKIPNPILDTQSKAIWYMGFHAAIQITNIFAGSASSEEPNSADDSGKLVTIYYPKTYFQILVMASMYLINHLAIDRSISINDKLLAQNQIKKIYETLTHWSREPRDEAARVARVIDLLSRHVQTQDLSSELQQASHDETPPMSIITTGMRLAGKLRSKLPGPFSQPSSESSPAWVSELPEFPGDIEPSLFEGDLLEWNTWLVNMDNIHPTANTSTGYGDH